MKKFQKEDFVMIRTAIDSALAEVENMFPEIKLSIGNITFNDYEFRTQLTGKLPQDANDEDVVKKNTSLSRLLGYDINIVGKRFQYQGQWFKVTEINMKRGKYPISAVNVETGKSFKFQRNLVIPGVEKIRL